MPSLYIVWTERNDLGIPIIDEQHRAIVSSINTLYYFLEQGNGIEALIPTFNILEQYVDLHFKTEERLLRNASYPQFEEHLVLHKVLVENTTSVRNQSVINKDPMIALKFLKEWWMNHINVEDRKYVKWLK